MLKLKKLSDKEIIGQLFIISLKADKIKTRADREKIKRKFFNQYPPGGVLISGGSLERVFATVQWLQSISKVPLWIAADVERGLSGVFSGGTDFPHFAMASAANSPALVAEMGKAIARECRAVGINLLFSPMVDLLTSNTIINIRSFHEQPEKVIELASQLNEGIYSEKLLPAIKHFPGHGPASHDSHIQSAKVDFDRNDWNNSNISIFREIADKFNHTAIMTGHLLHKDSDKLVTFDGKYIQESKKHMGHHLLFISDDLQMGGCQLPSDRPMGESLFFSEHHHFINPPFYKMAAEQIHQLISSNEKYYASLLERVQNIFSFKKRFIGNQAPDIHFQQIYKHVSKIDHKKNAQKIARKGIISLDEESNIKPLQHDNEIHHIIIAPESHLHSALNTFRKLFKNAPVQYHEWFNSIPDNISNDSKIIVSFYQRTFAGASFSPIPDTLNLGLISLAAKNSTFNISWGNVFIYQELFQNLKGLKLWIPSYMPVAQKAVYNALWGKFPIAGTLPVTLNDKLKAGMQNTITLAPNKILPVKNEDKTLQMNFEKYIQEKAFSGMAAFTMSENNLNYHTAGKAKNVRNKEVEITEDSLFDLASLTKVFSTTLLILHLLSQKKISLNDTLGYYFIDCPDDKKQITIQQLLTHTAGLKSWTPLYEQTNNAEKAIKIILDSSLENAPGDKVVYSDLGFMLLAKIIEYILDKPIHYAFRDIIAVPLGIENDLFFLTPQKLSDTRLIASNSNWKTNFNYLQFINDKNARLFPSGTGHAGLFGNLTGITTISKLILNNGIWYDKIIIDPEIMKNSFEVFTAKDGSQRALSWDITGENTQAGKHFENENSRGHLAYTGCSFWFDTVKKTAALLLANRSFTEFPGEKYKNIRKEIFDKLGNTLK